MHAARASEYMHQLRVMCAAQSSKALSLVDTENPDAATTPSKQQIKTLIKMPSIAR